ncbi:hypothetical protein DPMN_079359 [Dreissena polymorpha]|uniref:Uncharacterized protein n=1 Tax=Dreissena polymorpha TaxID=45954 RepID=A0A9D3YS36_DREPO|nr:hypothetical protein DPMN_079359 [Dreissena polymorpha]
MTVSVTPHAKIQFLKVSLFRENTGALNANVLSVVRRTITHEEKVPAVDPTKTVVLQRKSPFSRKLYPFNTFRTLLRAKAQRNVVSLTARNTSIIFLGNRRRFSRFSIMTFSRLPIVPTQMQNPGTMRQIQSAIWHCRKLSGSKVSTDSITDVFITASRTK